MCPQSVFPVAAYFKRVTNSNLKGILAMKRNLLVNLVLMALAISAAVAGMKNPTVGGQEMYPTKNIIQNAVNSADHTTLVAAVKAAGLVETLQSPGPFTVFAPTNDAFGKLPSGAVETLLKPENLDSLKK